MKISRLLDAACACAFSLCLSSADAGTIFTNTGNGSLMSFDVDTLLQTGGASLTAVSAGQDLTFDDTGRLFGQLYDGNNNLVEYDPTTLSIINQTSLSGGRTTGLAAVSAVPLPSAVWLFSFGLLGLIGISRRKKAA